MNKPYPGVLVLSTPIVQKFILEGALPSGTSIIIDWVARTIDLGYPPSGDKEKQGFYKEKTAMVLKALENPQTEEGDEAFIDPEPELPMEQTNLVDATKEKKYVVMDSEGWSHAPNGTRFSNQQKAGNSPLISLFKELEKLIAKEKMPVCCFALANARGNPDISPHISGQLSSLFMRGVLRRQKYHCECRGCVDVSDGRTIYHYQLMSGGVR